MIPEAHDAPDDSRRMITVLPTLFTLANLLAGWLAIAWALDGRPGWGAVSVLVAAFLDKVDGYVARATASSSDFGRELDSLADVVSFGVAPAMVSFAWGLDALGNVGAAAAFLFTACGALRLARFNILAPAVDKRWFVGLPIPMAAAVPMTLVVSHGLSQDSFRARLQDPRWAWVFAALLLLCAGLMVSSIRYYAFKESTVAKRRRMVPALAFVLVLAGIVAAPQITLPLLAIAYLVHGPVLRVARVTTSGKSAMRPPAGTAA